MSKIVLIVLSLNIENEMDIINHSTYYNYGDFRGVLKNIKSELSILNLSYLNLTQYLTY